MSPAPDLLRIDRREAEDQPGRAHRPAAVTRDRQHLDTAIGRSRDGRCSADAARLALGAAFLSAVAGRFGLWTGAPWSDAFARFVAYTAEVNAFMAAAAAPWLAWVATAAEASLGTALVLGIRVREAALGSAVLLAIFGIAMAISFGLKSPMDYSVFSASAGALLLASRPRHAPDASR